MINLTYNDLKQHYDIITSQYDFDSAKIDDKVIEFKCKVCQSIIKRSKRQIKTSSYKSTNVDNINSLKYCCNDCKKDGSYTILKCNCCGKLFERLTSKTNGDDNHYCSRSCRTKVNNTKRSQETRNKQKQTLKQTLSQKDKHIKIERCKICGCVRGHCKYPNICKSGFISNPKRRTLIQSLGFDLSVIGTLDVKTQYDKIRQKLYKDYVVNEETHQMICDKYHIPSTRSTTLLFKWLDIPVRTPSERRMVSYDHDRVPLVYPNSKYVHGWFDTWDNRKVYLRSSYELDYLNQLNEQKVRFDVECLRIKYFDTQENRERIAIPDFYLPDSNTIVEVKSSFTYNEQNMIDKFKAYRLAGYNCNLLLDHQYVDL